MGGGALAGPSGSAAGFSLANHVANWLGMGDYAVKNNSLVTKPVPSMHKTSQSVIVRHREFIGDVVSSGTANAFTSQSYSLNPGLGSTFPWLSSIAQCYQEYDFKGVIFEYHSSSADAIASSTNTTLGTVHMVTLYRNSIPITSKQQVLNEFFANDAKPSEDFVHPVECDPAENPFKVQYVRGGAVPAGEDIKMYDLGTFYVCSSGVQGTSVVLGELWATYEVELKKPVFGGPSGGGDLYGTYAHYTFTPANSTPLSSSVKVFDDIGLSFTNLAMSWPNGTVGTYMCYYVAYGGATSTVAPTITPSASGVAPTGASFSTGTSNAAFSALFFVTFTANPGQLCYVTFGAGGTLPTAPAGVMYVTQIPSPWV